MVLTMFAFFHVRVFPLTVSPFARVGPNTMPHVSRLALRFAPISLVRVVAFSILSPW